MANYSGSLDLVDALLRCRFVRDDRARREIVELLPQDIVVRIPRHQTAQLDVVAIVNTCCEQKEGLEYLIKAVRTIEGDEALCIKRVLKVYKKIEQRDEYLSTAPSRPQAADTASFTGLVRNFCEQIGWTIAEIDATHALLEFEMRSGRTQVVLLVPFEETLELSVPSLLLGEFTEDLRDELHELSTLLLLRNSQSRYAFWTIAEIDGQEFFSCMHNAEFELLNVLHFKLLVEALILECDAFEQYLEDIPGEQHLGVETALLHLDF